MILGMQLALLLNLLQIVRKTWIVSKMKNVDSGSVMETIENIVLGHQNVVEQESGEKAKTEMVMQINILSLLVQMETKIQLIPNMKPLAPK